MQGMFDDEWRETDPFRANLRGAPPIMSLDFTAQGLKWATRRRLAQFAIDTTGLGDTAATSVDRS